MAEGIVKTYIDTSLGKFIFDAYMNINHDSTLAITSHPVQDGANVADHAYMEPQEVTFEVGMSDVMSNISGFDSFTGDNSRSISAYKTLRKLQEERLPIKIVTRLWTYENMLVENISAPDDKKTAHGLKATVTLKEILVANVRTVKISERPQKSEQSNEGDQKAQEADESLLSKLLG
ncbi:MULTISPECIES: phage baseplate protein [Clostridium]|jgi:hypothetical protein|uniref:phage baseplate protein n=1 Tax=Clostridium TaxID=1485 RepID=UPI0005C1BDC4|nr:MULTISPECIES: hypothetical protein [Clostridium]DAL62070.1 MAG TPA_asm: hypothetical protein [Caudoviricetes sp.]KIU07740.1 hypothetical protein SC08_Contig83orf01661 [Clostridium butyricum]MBA8967570.1 hypothetical protein [Clostridium butyricum]MBA8971363.1 hypothetical protein [Clostridium butyricum]MBC2429140.1 hypothetical protein [Clostridium butyricum]